MFREEKCRDLCQNPVYTMPIINLKAIYFSVKRILQSFLTLWIQLKSGLWRCRLQNQENLTLLEYYYRKNVRLLWVAIPGLRKLNKNIFQSNQNSECQVLYLSPSPRTSFTFQINFTCPYYLTHGYYHFKIFLTRGAKTKRHSQSKMRPVVPPSHSLAFSLSHP